MTLIDFLKKKSLLFFNWSKHLADLPSAVYILAFDYDFVVYALSKVQHGDGKEYLEKSYRYLLRFQRQV